MIRQRLLQYLLPWLYNMELVVVDPNIQPMSPLAKFQVGPAGLVWTELLCPELRHVIVRCAEETETRCFGGDRLTKFYWNRSLSGFLKLRGRVLRGVKSYDEV